MQAHGPTAADPAMPAAPRRSGRLLLCVAFGVSALLVSLDTGLEHFGVPSDEAAYHHAAILHVRWIGSICEPGAFAEERVREHFAWRPEVVIHPTFSRLLSGASWALFHGVFGVDEIAALRMHGALAYGLLAVGVVGFAFRSLGALPAIVSLLLFWSMIRLFGHAHTAGPDLVLTCLWLWATLAFARTLDRARPGPVLAAALLAGLALATKLTGLELVVLLALWAAVAHGRRAAWSVPLLLGVPVAVAAALDPIAWLGPWDWAARFFRDFTGREREIWIPTLFLGERYEHRVPWYVPAMHGVLTISPAVVLLGLVAAARGLGALRDATRGGAAGLLALCRNPWSLFVASGFSTLVAASLPQVPAHDVERLFLPLQPFLVLFAAYGFAILAESAPLRALAESAPLRALGRHLPGPPARAGALALAAALCVPPLVEAVRQHPYPLAYWNFFVGGARGAEALGFDVAYYKLEANQSMLDALNEHVAPGETLYANFLRFDLAEHQRAGRLKKGIRLVRTPPADYILFHARRSWMTHFETRLWKRRHEAGAVPVWALRHRGVELVSLYRLRRAS